MNEYDLPAIRRFLIKFFDDLELRYLASDYFRDVYEDFTTGMRKSQMAEMLVEYCHRLGRIPDLIASLQRERERPFTDAFPNYVLGPASHSHIQAYNPKQIFISHAHQDAELAHRLAQDLVQAGWQVWIAPQSIQTGEKWVEAISRGLEESGIFLLLITPAAVNSRWVQSETNIAIELDHQQKIRFIPLKVKTANEPLLWRAYQHIPISGQYTSDLQNILGELDGRYALNEINESSAIKKENEPEKYVVPYWEWLKFVVKAFSAFSILSIVLFVILTIWLDFPVSEKSSEVTREVVDPTKTIPQVPDITQLTAQPFYKYTDGTSLTSIVLQEGLNSGIFTLDQEKSLVYEHETDDSYLNPLSTEPQVHVFKGQLRSLDIGNIIDIVWRPVGNAVTSEGLAMLDGNGVLLTYRPNLDNTFAAPLDLASEWQTPVAMANFDERLYVLDIGAEVIWKYFPNGDEFTVNADDLIIFFNEDAELKQAIDFDFFNQDGGLVLLYADGRIRYYDTRSSRMQWDEADLLANGLQTPLVAPTAVKIVGKGLNASIFIADPGSSRIVQISRPTGQVLAQYRATDSDGHELFSQITDFAVAETPLRIFVTTKNELIVATQE
jgi:hypothetical protein